MTLRALLALVALVASALPAEAVEYRLRVASLHEGSFAHFLNGRIGRGEGELRMDRLERSLDAGAVARGALLYRPPEGARPGILASFGAVRARGEVAPAEGPRSWDEVVWDGRPGERSLWVIAPAATHFQEVVHVAVGGREALRYYVPYGVSGGRPAPVVAYPLQFLWFHEERGRLWERYLGRAVSLSEGLAVVVGVNENPTFADWVYVLIEHPPAPTTFRVVVGWDRRRSADRSNVEGITREP